MAKQAALDTSWMNLDAEAFLNPFHQVWQSNGRFFLARLANECEDLLGELVCLLGTAHAQAPSASALATARELVETKGGAAMFDPVIVSVVEQTKGALLQTNPQLAKDLNDVATQLRTEFTPRRDELMGQAAYEMLARHCDEFARPKPRVPLPAP